MELLGLIWAASLPHQNAAMRMSQTLSSAEFSHGDEQVNGESQSAGLDPVMPAWHRLGLPSVAPQGFRTQLSWQATPALDWEKWAVTAKVTVIPQGATIKNLARKTDNRTVHPALQAIEATCPAANDDLAKLGEPWNAASTTSTDTNTTEGYSIQVNNLTIGTLPQRDKADAVAAQIRRAISTVEAHPTELRPQIRDGVASAVIRDQTVFELTDEMLPDQDPAVATTVTAWVNNLRHGFGAPILDLGKTQMVAQGLGETDQVIGGTASWYGPYFHGRLTATGEIFDQHELTAAHKTLPFGTMLKVRNLLNNKTVVVRINDRGPYIGDRSLDLSYAAAQCLDGETIGLIPYEATLLEPGLPMAWQAENTVAQR
jgi:rare lipoprotein A (peptidoglycan hydrolase)